MKVKVPSAQRIENDTAPVFNEDCFKGTDVCLLAFFATEADNIFLMLLSQYYKLIILLSNKLMYLKFTKGCFLLLFMFERSGVSWQHA